MMLKTAFDAENAEKTQENAKVFLKNCALPKREQRISLCALCGSAISALKELCSELLNKKRCTQRGFTLIEILVVVSILAILGALIVPKIMDRPNEARVVAAKHDIGTVVAALKLYKLDNGRYPTTEQGLQALVEKPTSEPVPANWKSGGYLEKMPKDPWGHDYLYLNPGIKREIDVMSYGADGQQGGEGFDADLGSWML